MGVVVRIDRFSGPLALLLHLIRQEQMDIFDINIHDITKQYLDSIKSMKKLNLEVAGDFIAMASTLIQIKSKMLLPQYNEEGEIIEDADPRRDLVQRLIEYQMYQDAGHNIYKRALLGRDVWIRGRREEFEEPKDDSVIIEEDNALYSLISMYRAAFKKMNKAVHKVTESLQSIADRVWELRDRLIVGRPTQLTAILAADGEVAIGDRRGKLLITFLSLLELAKIGIVELFQSDNFSDIHIHTMKNVDRDAISNVESYDSQVTGTASALSGATNSAAVSGDIWLSDNDRNFTEAPAEVLSEETITESSDTSLGISPAPEFVLTPEAPAKRIDEEYIIEAATDLDIELEEQLYGESKEQSKIEEVSQFDLDVERPVERVVGSDVERDELYLGSDIKPSEPGSDLGQL